MFVKSPFRSSANWNTENNGKFCFLWSILAHLHLRENGEPNRVSTYRPIFDELLYDGFDFSKGLQVVMYINLKNWKPYL